MTMLPRRASEFIVGDEGPTATEYAVMLALIIVVAIVSIQAFGISLSDTFFAVVGGLFS
jgi:pilus assembly protein Flp/PilA